MMLEAATLPYFLYRRYTSRVLQVRGGMISLHCSPQMLLGPHRGLLRNPKRVRRTYVNCRLHDEPHFVHGNDHLVDSRRGHPVVDLRFSSV